jgi:hypothetical protein
VDSNDTVLLLLFLFLAGLALEGLGRFIRRIEEID